MIDPEIIRKDPERVKKVIASGRGNPSKANIDKWLEIDSQKKATQLDLEKLNQEKNQIAELGKKDPESAKVKGKEVREKITTLEDKLATLTKEWQEILDWVPNMPISNEAMPNGKSEEDNPIDKAWDPAVGYIDSSRLGTAVPKVDYMPERSIHWDKDLNDPKHHLDLGEELGIIDNKQSAKVSGSRFTYLLGDAVLIQYAIQQLLYSKLLQMGFVPVIPPLLVKERSLYGTSHFPEGRDQVYQIQSDNVEDKSELYLVGSSEPTNFSYFMDRVMKEAELPFKVFAYTPCFRSEVGSWGKDVKGIKRVHQFDKIEMNVVCTPSQSNDIFRELLSVNEWLLQSLEIPYRLARKCTSDAGYLASAEQVDPEAWLPGQREFIEVGTDTNTTDYQARRLNIKFSSDQSGKKEYVHTVNDTGVAMGRMIISIIDNYQQSDGSIKVPEVLKQYIGKDFIKKK